MRFGHFLSMKQHNPVFDLPVVDSVEYVSDAHYYTEQNWMGRYAAYPHPPLYPFVIALLFKIFGNSLDVIKLFQILIELANTFLIYLIARRVFNETVGLASAALYALYIPAIFYSTEILPPTLAVFLLLISILCLLEFYLRQSTGTLRLFLLSLSGVSFGLLMITLFNFIFSLPFILLWQYKNFKQTLTRRLLYLFVFLAFSLAPAALVTSRNCMFANDCVGVSRNGGSNFYIGNNPDVRKTVSLREGIEWIGFRLSPLENNQIHNYAQVDSFFYIKALTFIVHYPLTWLWLILKKTVLFFNAYELARNFDFYFFSNYSALTQLPFVRLGFILPLAISAMLYLCFAARNNKNKPLFNLMLIIILSYSCSIILFFVTGRYRLPIIPIFIILSAYYIVTLVDFCRCRNYLVAAGLLACASFFTILTQQKLFINTYPYRLNRSHTYAQIARALLSANQPKEAYRFIREGFKAGTDESTYELYGLLGRYYTETGEGQKATAFFKKSIGLNPQDFLSCNSIASLFIKEGRPYEAVDYFEKAMKAAPYYFGTYVSLAEHYNAIGDSNHALSVLLSYREICPSGHPIIEYYMGKYYMDSIKDTGKAITHFEKAVQYPQFLDRFETICSDLYNRLGLCYLQTEQLQKAKRIWSAGLRFFPRDQAIRKNLSLHQ